MLSEDEKEKKVELEKSTPAKNKAKPQSGRPFRGGGAGGGGHSNQSPKSLLSLPGGGGGRQGQYGRGGIPSLFFVPYPVQFVL